MTDRVLCISQARMTSSRLPGKIMKTVCGRSLLDYHTSRLLRSQTIDRLVIATTVRATDDPVAVFCQDHNIACIRGSETDVLARYGQAARAYPADIIVRVTSDCPLIDPVLLDRTVTYFRENQDRYDYLSLTPGVWPRGLDVEVFTAPALFAADAAARLPAEREHVTPYLYRPDSPFCCGRLPADAVAAGHHRWCVDEAADFDLIQHILTAFDGRDDFSWQAVLHLFDQNPDWYTINSQVTQKALNL